MKKSIFNSTLLTLPSAVLLLFMIAFPVFMLVVFSFAKGNILFGMPSEFTTSNYIKLFSNSTFYILLLKSIAIGLEATVICLVVSIPVAWALAKVIKDRCRGAAITLLIIPYFTSQLLIIYSILVLLESKGAVMSLLGALNIANSSDSIIYTKACVVIILVYEYLPYMILSLYSSFEKIDDEIIMASHTLGAGSIRTFTKVVIPMCMPGIITGIILVFVPTVGSFVEPSIAGGPSGMMIGSLIDSNFNMSLNMCFGATISLAFLAVLLAITLLLKALLDSITSTVGGKTK
jgi:spermidine/putrescine transport system permease protein